MEQGERGRPGVNANATEMRQRQYYYFLLSDGNEIFIGILMKNWFSIQLATQNSFEWQPTGASIGERNVLSIK